VPPQPSEIVPHSAPAAAQVVGVQPHWLLVHRSGSLQLPQTIVLPHPSSIVPHVAPTSAQVFGVQPQALGRPPPPQVSGAWQVPQSSTLPHPSLALPHSAPSS
jgi:hypothetical protein